MVRTHIKQSADETKQTPEKRASSRVKTQQQISGVWLCKMNDCNKRFVREADLKRHQRTSKEHSNSRPILCPQCDSTFTRSDALRRHQKSRHNGVIIDPEDSANSKDEEGEGEGKPAPQGRSHSPGRSRGRKRKSSPIASVSTSVPVQTILTAPDAPGPSTGSQSYYRRNTVNAVFVSPRTLNGTLYASTSLQPQLPMSTARFHAWAPNYPSEPDKTNSARSPSGSATFVQTPPTGYYPPGAYYRAPNGQPVIPLHAPNGVVTMQVNPSALLQPNGNASKDDTNASPPKSPATDFDSNIDPSLQGGITAAETSEKKAEVPTREKRRETGAFTGSGLSPDVQKVLQAVLAIDPGNASSSNFPKAQEDSENSRTESTHDAKRPFPSSSADVSAQQTSGILLSDQQNVPASLNDKDIVDADADGEADTDGEGSLQESQDRPRDSIPESSFLPDGIKELINEDSLSYAPP